MGGVRLLRPRRKEDPQDVSEPGRGASVARRHPGRGAEDARARAVERHAHTGGSAWFKGARDGTIRTRSGDVYKPAAIRAYEIAFRLRVKPKLGSMRVSQVTRSDVQDLVDDLVAKSSQPSTIVVTVSAIRVI